MERQLEKYTSKIMSQDQGLSQGYNILHTKDSRVGKTCFWFEIKKISFLPIPCSCESDFSIRNSKPHDMCKLTILVHQRGENQRKLDCEKLSGKHIGMIEHKLMQITAEKFQCIKCQNGVQECRAQQVKKQQK